MATEVEAEARILGGLPVLVIGRLHPAEPDVGIFDEQPEIDNICWLGGKSIPTAMWQRISQSDLDDCHEALRDAQTCSFWDRADYLYEQRRDRMLDEQIDREFGK
jgi:hypothetical protein